MRKLTPELLDTLPHDDPGAICSRRDLVRINRFMGNDSWILRHLPQSPTSITEIGAGDGHLLKIISREFPETPIRAYDLAPRPVGFPEKIEWVQGDLFKQPPAPKGGVLIANLFLHHFHPEQLTELGHWLENFDTILINEPLRSKLPLMMGKLAHPFIHPITRHDMHVSIEAGFVPNELASQLHLDGKGFIIKETSTWRGSIRVIASRA
ncbi:hypothetical protein ACFSSA_10595 [Luteolibacter algae]|uniref:Methyltransferase domain-containing protein n=1 Tax=Luteolibacter algae TaxID=454151 RepID=A0ABW5D8B7_9BACT